MSIRIHVAMTGYRYIVCMFLKCENAVSWVKVHVCMYTCSITELCYNYVAPTVLFQVRLSACPPPYITHADGFSMYIGVPHLPHTPNLCPFQTPMGAYS